MITLNHFGSCIARRTTLSLQLLIFFIYIAEAEINNFDSTIEVYQNIFGLDISMGNSYAVHILDAIDDLLENFASLGFG